MLHVILEDTGQAAANRASIQCPFLISHQRRLARQCRREQECDQTPYSPRQAGQIGKALCGGTSDIHVQEDRTTVDN